MSGRLLATMASLLFVPAWFVTAAHTTGDLLGGRTAGWQAFLFAISPLLGNDLAQGLPLRIWMVASALSNALIVATLGLVIWRPRAIGRRLAGAMGASTVINAYWFVLPEMRDDLRVGYYMWLAGCALATAAAWFVARPVHRRHADGGAASR